MLPFSSRRQVLAGVLLCGSLVVAVSASHHAVARAKPAPEFAPQAIEVAPGAKLPLYVSRDWSQPLPDIERAGGERCVEKTSTGRCGHGVSWVGQARP